MFDTKKFGAYLARCRKNADMTQSNLAEKLNVTRQAVSCYETGDSFPDVSILLLIADLFGVTLDELIRAGEPTKGEAEILKSAARGEEKAAGSPEELANLAPWLKPSVLGKLTQGLESQGIDVHIWQELLRYASDDALLPVLEKADFREPSEELLSSLDQFTPLLPIDTVWSIYNKILDGKIDWHFLRLIIGILPYSHFEAALIDGAFPPEAQAYYKDVYQEKRAKKIF